MRLFKGNVADLHNLLNIHIQLLPHLKEKGLHGWVDEGVSKQAKAVEGESEDDHIVVPEQSVEQEMTTFKWKYELRPKSADDEGAADGEGDPGNGADSQGETHCQLGWAKILKEPEEVGFKEAPHGATDEEDDKKHEDVRLQD